MSPEVRQTFEAKVLAGEKRGRRSGRPADLSRAAASSENRISRRGGWRRKLMKRGKSVDFTGYWQRHIAS
jgi:hypothetical protein